MILSVRINLLHEETRRLQESACGWGSRQKYKINTELCLSFAEQKLNIHNFPFRPNILLILQILTRTLTINTENICKK